MHDVFYFTDVHGCYDLYKAAMNYCKEQDPECSIIFGGDACDRGADGYKIMCELLEDPQVLYLKGNHEDMFVRAARYILNDLDKPLDYETAKNYLYKQYIMDNPPHEIFLSLYNGGLTTLAAWIADGMPNDFVTRISQLPLTFSWENYDFCHAGAQYKVFQRVAQDEYDNEYPDRDDETDLLWDRTMLRIGWAPNRICVYGHTCVNELPAIFYGADKSDRNIHPCKYSGDLDDRLTGEKIAMDTATINTGKLYVLNCLTQELQGFRDVNLGKVAIQEHKIEKIEMIQF